MPARATSTTLLHVRLVTPALVSLCLVSGGCGKTSASSDAAASHAASSASLTSGRATAQRLPVCEPWIVTALELPSEWRTYPVIATSGPPHRLDSRSVDHFVDELIALPVGPFELRYWHGLNQPSAGGLVLRLAGCEGAPLDIVPIHHWDGEPSLVLRRKENIFILSGGGQDETLLAVVRRLPM